MKRITEYALIGLAALTATGAVHALPVVVNGDFEADAGLFTFDVGYAGAGDNPDEITAWPGTGHRGINPTLSGNRPFANNGANLTHVAFLQIPPTGNPADNGSINQTISGFIPGEIYDLSFDYNARDRNNTLGNFRVSIAGFTHDFLNTAPVDPSGTFDTPYYHFIGQFTVLSTTETLTFTGLSGNDETVLLDNIVITPEPSSAALLGVAGLLLMRRR
jgi:hypothetical protein